MALLFLGRSRPEQLCRDGKVLICYIIVSNYRFVRVNRAYIRTTPHSYYLPVDPLFRPHHKNTIRFFKTFFVYVTLVIIPHSSKIIIVTIFYCLCRYVKMTFNDIKYSTLIFKTVYSSIPRSCVYGGGVGYCPRVLYNVCYASPLYYIYNTMRPFCQPLLLDY